MMERMIKRLLASMLVLTIMAGTIGIYMSRLVAAANLGNYTVVYDEATATYITSYGLPVSVQGTLQSQGITIRSSNTSNYSVDGNSGFMCISAGRESPNGTGGTVYRCVNTSVYDNSSDSLDSYHNTLQALSGLTYSQIVYGCYSLGRNGGSSWAYAHAILSYLIGGDSSWFGPLSTSNAYSSLTTFAGAAAASGRSSSADRVFYVFVSKAGRQDLIALDYHKPSSGSVTFDKTDGSIGLSGAVIQLLSSAEGAFSGISVSGVGYTNVSGGIEFTTNGNTIEISGLRNNTSYVFHEVNPPSGYRPAADITVTVDSDGNVTNSADNDDSVVMIDTNIPTGSISFNKVDSSGNENDAVRTAVIEFCAAPDNTVPDAMTDLSFDDYTGTAGYDAAGSSAGYPRILFTASSVGTDITIHRLKPGARYVFREVVVPEGYVRANDVIVNVLSDGNCQVDGQLTGMVTMYNHRPDGLLGSVGIIKRFDNTDPQSEQQFWSNVGSVDFQFYAINTEDWGIASSVIDSGYWPYVTTGVLRPLNYNPSVNPDLHTDYAVVYWDAGDQSGNPNLGNANYANYYYPGRWWQLYSQTEDRWITQEYSVSVMQSLPNGYYIISETWQEGQMVGSYENMYIETLNSSGWHQVRGGNGIKEYAQIYLVQGNTTYTVDWYTGAITGILNEVWWTGDNPNWNYSVLQTIVNTENTGAVDLTKIDMTAGGVEGLSFELWRGASRYATGHISNSESPDLYDDIHYEYQVDWNYETMVCVDRRNNIWQSVANTNMPAVYSLNYGTYQLREIIPDGREFVLPEGWYQADEDNDGSPDYFYRNIEVTSDSQITPATASIVNREYRLNITVNKTDEWTGQLLSGYEGSRDIEFSLYVDNNSDGILDDNDTLIGTASDTDRDGIIVFDYKLAEVFPGVSPSEYPTDYLVAETGTPDDYYVHESPVAVSVPRSNYNGTVTVADTPYSAQIRIVKLDGDTGAYIPNALFTVYNDVDSNGSYTEGVDTVAKTYVNGTLCDSQIVWNMDEDCYVSSSLRSGRYVVVETGLPAGYLYVDSNGVPTLSRNEIAVEITGRDTTVMGFVPDRYEYTVYNLSPRIQTTLISRDTGTHIVPVGPSVELTDTVSYRNLAPGEEYILHGSLMNRSDGQPLCDRDGRAYTSEVVFIPQSSEGTVNVSFFIDTEYLTEQLGEEAFDAPFEIVCFEDLDLTSGRDVCEHNDISDAGQTVRVGQLVTGVYDSKTLDQITSSGLATIIDNVHYEGLQPGTEYEVAGHLHLVEYDSDGNRIDAGVINEASPGEVLSPVTSFIPTASEGYVQVTFVVDTNRYRGRTTVAFEDLYHEGRLIMTHADINDQAQTMEIPLIHTNAYGSDVMGDVVAYSDRASVTDQVYYENLLVGRTYTVQGSLYWMYTDDNGNVHSGPVSSLLGDLQGMSTAVFTAESTDGVIDLQFVFDSTVLAGLRYDKLVIMETLYLNGESICSHWDLNDEAQTVYIPELHTTASDTLTGLNVLSESAGASITDRVYYENLQPGREYTVTGSVQYVKTDGSGNIISTGTLVQDGREVTAQVTFVPSLSNGYVDMTFAVNGLEVADIDKLVVYEDMYSGPGVRIATHADISDEGQTVEVCELSSSAVGQDGDRMVAVTDDASVTDTVFYSGLQPGRNYRVETDLMNVATGQSDMHCSTVFCPGESDGSIDITLNFDANGYTGNKLVVFESVYDEQTGILIKSHCDWNEKSQTVSFTGGPDIPQTGMQYDSFYRKTGIAILGFCLSVIVIYGVPAKSRSKRRDAHE